MYILKINRTSTVFVDGFIANGNNLLLISMLDNEKKIKKANEILTSSLKGQQLEIIDLKTKQTVLNNISLGFHMFNIAQKTEVKVKDTTLFNSIVDFSGNYNEIVIYNFNNVDKYEQIVNFFQYKRYLPLSKDILEKTQIKETQITTYNENIKHIKAYILNEQSILNKITKQNTLTLNGKLITNMEEYLLENMNDIKEKLNNILEPIVNSEKDVTQDFYRGNIKPMKGQEVVWQAGLEVLKTKKFLMGVCEMGFGKTIMGLKINELINEQKFTKNYTTLIVCPTTTLGQWQDEIKAVLGDKPHFIHVIRDNKDMFDLIKQNKFNRYTQTAPTFFLTGKETLKEDSKLFPSILINKKEKPVCPDCLQPIENLTLSDFSKKTHGNYKCKNCGSKLWSALVKKDEEKDLNYKKIKEKINYIKDFKESKKKEKLKVKGAKEKESTSIPTNKKVSVYSIIKKKKIIFHSIIIDEIHQGKSQATLIGLAQRGVFNNAKKVIGLTGTSNNGYADSYFNLLMSFCPDKLKRDGLNEIETFSKRFGSYEFKIKNEEEAKYTGRNIPDSSFKKTEGISPILYTKYFIENFIYADLRDIKREGMPELKEIYVPVSHFEKIKNSTQNAVNFLGKNKFNMMLQIDRVIKHYINNPVGWGDLIIKNSKGTEESYDLQNFDINNILLPKETMLLNIVKKEIKEGRKVFVYTTFINPSNSQYDKNIDSLAERITRILKENGIKACLFTTSSTKSPAERKAWLDEKRKTVDVFVCNPKLVEVGLNLVWCPTYVNYIPNLVVSEVEQSIRRGMRANATKENRVYHLYYANTFEETLKERYERKKAESTAIESKFNVQLESEKVRTSSQLGKKISNTI